MDKFTITPNRIEHHETPAFQASWISGEVKPTQNNSESFHIENSGGNDQLLIESIKWQDQKPDQDQINQLMNEAITAIDNWIAERF